MSHLKSCLLWGLYCIAHHVATACIDVACVILLCLQIIATWHFDWRYMVRGLTIDKQRGNMLKIDRHKYVKVAYHGFRELTRAERRAVYSDTNVSSCFSCGL